MSNKVRVVVNGSDAMSEEQIIEETPQPAPAAALRARANAEGELHWIAIEELHESPWNPRTYFPEKSLAELAASMETSGFWSWSPLMARPRDCGIVSNGYEVGAGHRRLRAAIRAGLKTLPVIIRRMDDDEFLRVLTFDNCNREDQHPLDESDGFRRYIDRTGATIQQVAAEIGQSKEYVYERLKYADLIQVAREAFWAKKISARQAVRIARLPERYQLMALDYCAPSWDGDRYVTTRQLDEWVKANCMLSLRHAAFDPADQTLLPVAGSCTACPKRSGSNPEIFRDLEDTEICTDPGCYKLKLTAAEDRKPKAPVIPAPVAVAAAPEPAAPKPQPPPKKKQDTEAGQKQAEQERAAEAARVSLAEERAARIYARSLDAILEKITWPLAQEDVAVVFSAVVDSLECHSDLADKFAIKRDPIRPRWRDIVVAARTMSPEKMARMMICGILMDYGVQEGQYLTSDHPLARAAKRYKVDVAKIAQAVDAELAPQPAAPVSAPEAKKAAAKKAPDAPRESNAAALRRMREAGAK